MGAVRAGQRRSGNEVVIREKKDCFPTGTSAVNSR